MFLALIVISYVAPPVSPVGTTYVDVVVGKVVHDPPESRYATTYPVIADPPFELGAAHETLRPDEDTDVMALRTTPGFVGVVNVLDSDHGPAPRLVRARSWISYFVSICSPLAW